MSTCVTISFDQDGAYMFSDLTGRLAGKPVAMFLDEKLLFGGMVWGSIENGETMISGFDGVEARRLAAILSAGPLPAPVSIIEIAPLESPVTRSGETEGSE